MRVAWIDSSERAVLQRGEAGLAHHALEHHAAGDADIDLLAGGDGGLECFSFNSAMLLMDAGCTVIWLEIVGEGDGAAGGLGLAQALELLAPFGDQLVLVLFGGGGLGHGVAGVGRRAGDHATVYERPRSMGNERQNAAF